MGTAAAGGGCGARRWLPWLGLCFWAAGAAAARGKRWVDGGAQRSGPRRSGTRTFGVGRPSCACFSPRAERDSVGTGGGAPGDHCLPIQVCYLPQSYRLL